MKKRVPVLIGCGVLCLLLAAGCFFWPWIRSAPTPSTNDFRPTTAATTAAPTAPETTVTTAPYVSPLDFASLQALNPDVCAWLQIDGTDISYPVVQSPDDDRFYLDHDSDKNESVYGAIFTEHAYNTADFSDPLTVMYGHNMIDGSMFGNLQEFYSDKSFFDSHRDVTVYLPHEEKHYRIFAALPYSRLHLYYYPVSHGVVFDQFFAELARTRTLGGILETDVWPKAGDQVIVLSTCLEGNHDYRFLVMAVCSQ